MITALQVVPTGIYILCDKTKDPIFPRWLGWFSIYVGLSYVPLSLMPFNETGPFSYDGLWNFWGLYIGGYLFYPISTVYMLRYIKREMRILDEAPQSRLQRAGECFYEILAISAFRTGMAKPQGFGHFSVQPLGIH